MLIFRGQKCNHFDFDIFGEKESVRFMLFVALRGTTFEKKGKYYFYGWPEYGINEPRYIDRCFVYSEGEM